MLLAWLLLLGGPPIVDGDSEGIVIERLGEGSPPLDPEGVLMRSMGSTDGGGANIVTDRGVVCLYEARSLLGWWCCFG